MQLEGLGGLQRTEKLLSSNLLRSAYCRQVKRTSWIQYTYLSGMPYTERSQWAVRAGTRSFECGLCCERTASENRENRENSCSQGPSVSKAAQDLNLHENQMRRRGERYREQSTYIIFMK